MRNKSLKTVTGIVVAPYLAFNIGHGFLEIDENSVHLPLSIQVLPDEPPPRTPQPAMQATVSVVGSTGQAFNRVGVAGHVTVSGSTATLPEGVTVVSS